MWNDSRTKGSRSRNIDTSLPHYEIVFPEYDSPRVEPMCDGNEDAETIFREIIKDGLWVRRQDPEMLEWINMSVRAWAFYRKVEPKKEEDATL